MSKAPAISSLTYLQLVKLIKSEISDGQKIIQQTQAEKYWSIGKAIDEYVLNGKDRANYGEHIYENLAKDLGYGHKTIERMVRFYREFPIRTAQSQLSWTHFRELLTLPDPKERKRLLTQAREKNLSTRELKEEIKKKKIVVPLEGPIPQLKFTRGKLYTYRVGEVLAGPGETIKEIDCGFSVFYEPGAAQTPRFTDGQIIETTKEGDAYSLHASDRIAPDLYTFKAVVEKIVDGDTIKTRVDLGFMTEKVHKLRFRGIDVPELSTPEGQKAKKFVEDRLKQCKFVIVKTYKDDKYGRYLVDVFYLIGEDDPAKVAAEGIFLNQELLDNRLAVKW